MTIRLKPGLKLAAPVLVFYLAAYVVLSWNGHYIWTQSGEVRYAWCLSVTDALAVTMQLE